MPVYRALFRSRNTKPVITATTASKHMEIWPMGMSRQRSFKSRTTMSEPPVEAPAEKTIPSPRPHNVPPYRAPTRVSIWGMGTPANRSMRAELTSIPRSDPRKNRRPTFSPARANRGRLMKMDTAPTLPKPKSSTKISATPEMPPVLISLGSKKQENPRANRALPSTVPAIRFALLRNAFMAQTSKDCCLSAESSSFRSIPAEGMVFVR